MKKPIFSPCTCNNENNKTEIGKIQRYSKDDNKFAEWEPLLVCVDCHLRQNKGFVISLSRGGTLVYHHNVIDENERGEVCTFMDQCDLFRQYKTNGFNEPRVHVLLSSFAQPLDGGDCGNNRNKMGPGYGYHGIRMRALPIKIAPPVESFAAKLAAKFNLPNNLWSIGVDLMTYRGGKDRIGWHADDNQGEEMIVTVVVETDPKRIVKIRPKKKKCKHESYHDGDEQIELIVTRGNGYRMNGM